MARGVGDNLRKGSEAQRTWRGNSIGIDDVLLIQQVFIQREEKTGALAVSHRSRYGAFIILPALRRLYDRELIAGIEDRVAKHEIQRAMVSGRSALGNYFQTRPARPREAGGIRVVIDLYFLHRRRRYARSIGLDSVYHQRDAAGAGCIVVQESRHGRDVVLIENGYAIQSVAIDGVGVLVVGGLRSDDWHIDPGRHRDAFGLDGNWHHNAEGRESFTGDRCRDAGVAKTFRMKLQRVLSGDNAIEAEGANRVGRTVRKDLAVVSNQAGLRLGNCCPGRVEQDSADRIRRRALVGDDRGGIRIMTRRLPQGRG